MLGIQEALKNSDWTTRKAASVALGDIAASCGSFLGSFKASCIRSLESCRFDKVCIKINNIDNYINENEPTFTVSHNFEMEFYTCYVSDR